MTTRFSSGVQSVILIGSALLITACATTNPETPVKTTEAVAESSARTTLPKGKFSEPPDIHPATMTKMIAAEDSASNALPDHEQPFGKSGTRINSKESQINVRSAPSTKSAVLAVLKSGQAIQVLESKEGWVRISWMQGISPRNGWIKKTFVEGN